jgi:cell division protein FtsI/penicillin-binding protein 2
MGNKFVVINRRIVILTVFLLLAFGAIVFRLVMLQIVSAKYYRALGDDQRTVVRKLTPSRGEIKIVDASTGESVAVATNIEKKLVYAVPKKILNKKETAEKLAAVLNMSEDDVLAKFSDLQKQYVPIKKQLSDSEVVAIKDLNLSGIEFDAEVLRFYPEKTLLSQVLGYVGYKDEKRLGLYGLEASFEDELRGLPGSLSQERDLTGAYIFGAKRDIAYAVDGDTLILSIDKSLQFKAEDVIRNAVTDNEADSGSIIIMNPKTGAVLAMANYPSFDPNEYSKIIDPQVFLNKSVTGNYEPGSVFKPLVVAAAINEGKVNPDSVYEDKGQVEIDGYTIKNSDGKAHGRQTMTQVLEESLNTGMIYIQDLLGNQTTLKYIKSFGFGKKVGVEVPESSGSLSNLQGNIAVNYATASFGQGISVTPIQLMQAYSALANNGQMMKPYLVQTKIKSTGEIEPTEPQLVKNVLTQKTASLVSAMLVNVVEKGHGKRAGVKGYYIAGKTGTAQVSKKDGKGYEENNNIGTFIGYGPVEDPKFLMLVRVNHPRTVKFAETTAAPAFGEMAQFILNYYNIAPTREK